MPSAYANNEALEPFDRDGAPGEELIEHLQEGIHFLLGVEDFDGNKFISGRSS
ncbi:MAG: hypothetical protein WCD20_18020 [Rhodomicrobium sp.]